MTLLLAPPPEQVFAHVPGIKVASAGVADDAEVPLDPELLAWADIIFVMEEWHRETISKKFAAHLGSKRIICLNIPDEFERMDPTLVRMLKSKVPPFLD